MDDLHDELQRAHDRALARFGPAPAELEPWLAPALPRSFAGAIREAAALAPGQAAALRQNYLNDGPTDRARAVCQPGGQGAALHRRLADLPLPRTRAALTKLVERAEAAGASAADIFGAAGVADLFRARPTWAALFLGTPFGGFQAPLFGRDADLAALAKDPRAPEDALDDRLASALPHELAHGARDRDALDPPYLDEAIVLWWTTLAAPESTFPAAGGVAVPGAPRLAEVGLALAREVGDDPLLRAHLGVQPWEEVLPPGLRAALGALGRARYRAHPAPHLLGEPHDPGPWLRLLAHAHDPLRTGTLPRVPVDRAAEPDRRDQEAVAWAWRGLGVVARVRGGVYDMRTEAPGVVRLDVDRGVLTRARKPDEVGYGPAESWLPWRVLPALRARWPRGTSWEVRTVDELLVRAETWEVVA